MKDKKKQKKWIRARHRIITNLVLPLLRPFVVWRYNIKIDRFKEQGDRAYLILLNHQTPFDQFFVALSFKNAVYYLATEDIFSKGWVSSIIRFLVNPIPIRKQTTDVAAVMTCIRVAKEGGTICLAPEGNRTYSGKTEYMNPAITKLAKKLKLPIALYRIEGGYGSEPRWSDVIRKGKMHAYVSKVIEPEEYANLSNDELFQLIEEGLYVNEAVVDGEYKSEQRAEYLERAIYVCPFCGLSEFESHGNEFTCKKCGKTITYGVDKVLRGNGFEFPLSFVNDWYEYQKDFVNNLDVLQYVSEHMYRDEANLSEVIPNKRKEPLREWAKIALYGDKIIIDQGQENEMKLPFTEVEAVVVLGRNKLNIYTREHLFQLKGSKRFNALKYVHIYHRYQNIVSGNADSKFLGL